MRASVPRTRVQFTGVRPWLCGDRDGSNGRRTKREKTPLGTHGRFSPLQIVHHDSNPGENRVRPTSSEPTHAISLSFKKECWNADPADESIQKQIADIYSFRRPAGLLHDIIDGFGRAITKMRGRAGVENSGEDTGRGRP